MTFFILGGIIKTMGWYLFQKSITFCFNLESSQAEHKTKHIRFAKRRFIIIVWLDYTSFLVVYVSRQDKERESILTEFFLCARPIVCFFNLQSSRSGGWHFIHFTVQEIVGWEGGFSEVNRHKLSSRVME